MTIGKSTSYGSASDWPHPRTWELRSQLPHVVILGAGASKAACSHDRNGHLVPVMNELASVPSIRDAIGPGLGTDDLQDFESLYGKLPRNRAAAVESSIYKYFNKLKLPDRVTCYDQLLLCLRPKDLIASFNWDPLLDQARQRNEGCAPLPRIVYLHGNVTVGYCKIDGISGSMNSDCKSCGNPLSPVRLLYPIQKKNYHQQKGYIHDQWNLLESTLADAYFLTIFGYRAPQSDIEAISLMTQAYDTNLAKILAEIHIIDIRNKRQLRKQWSSFTVGSHYGIRRNLSSCWQLTRYPRRSCEALAQATLANDPWEFNSLPKFRLLHRLQDWVRPLVHEESMNRFSGKTCSELRTEFGM